MPHQKRAPRPPRTGRVGYSNHARQRCIQRWPISRDPPHESVWRSAFTVPPRLARQLKLVPEKGTRFMATRDAVAVVQGDTIVTVLHVGYGMVDDMRATLLVRAMGLDEEVAVRAHPDRSAA